jgi:glycosyltransferase involved in cell wall biosynthesis
MEMPFMYDKNVYGGTEYMVRTWEQLVLPHMVNMEKYLCMVAPGISLDLPEIIKDGREVIFWLHNTKSQFNPVYVEKILGNPEYVKRVAKIVVPSIWHKLWTSEELNLPLDKFVVIPNAIVPLKYNPDKFDNIKQVKIIHTSSAYRGLPILMNSLRHIDFDFRLEVYNDYNPDLHYQGDQDTIDPRVRFFWKTPKRTLMEAVEASHIFAYPSIYLETFCLSLAESMSAGNLTVHSDLGALTEVANGHSITYDFLDDMKEHELLFAENLNKGIEKIYKGEWNPEEQVSYINQAFSWETITAKWIEFDKQLGDK